MNHAAMLVVALVLDALFGEPRWLWDRLPHPAVLMGRLVGWLDRIHNTGPNPGRAGLIGFAVLVLGAGVLGWFLAALPGLGWIIGIVLAAILLAQRSLVDHVRAVADALRLSTEEGRQSVAKIVGRDTAAMDDPAIARAAIESAAENLSDGIVAPAFWFLVLGLPGLLVYKMTNTADSMIGYRTERHRDFGRAAARFDDLLNWIPTRLTALIIAAVHMRPDTWQTIRRDAPLHRSPNAGWPEAAMAAVLGVALAGPRAYDGETREFPWVHGEARRSAGPDDIDRAVRVLWRVWVVLAAVCLLLAVV